MEIQKYVNPPVYSHGGLLLEVPSIGQKSGCQVEYESRVQNESLHDFPFESLLLDLPAVRGTR